MKKKILAISAILFLFCAEGRAQAYQNRRLSVVAPSISDAGAAGYISACAGEPSASPQIERFSIGGVNLTGNITITAPANFEVSLSAGSGYGTSLMLAETGGTVNTTTIFVRSAATAPIGNISGNVIAASPGAANLEIAVTGTINAISSVNAVSSVSCTAGQTTSPVTFNSTAGSIIQWANDNTAIGLAAGGTGDIPSFIATNAGTAPIKATITATPLASAFAYIPNVGDGTVSIVNTVTNSVVKTVPVGTSPFGVSISPNGSKVYIANNGSNNVSVLNTSSNTVTATVKVGDAPNGIVVGPSGKDVYVVNKNSRTISVIDASADAVVKTISLTDAPYGIALNPDGSRAYVTNYAANSITIVDLNAGTIIAAVAATGVFPVGIAVKPDGSEVYFTNQNSNSVVVLNTATNQVVASINVGAAPTGIAFSADGTKAYVCNAVSHSVSVINTATQTVTNTFLMNNTNALPYGISVSPDGSQLDVADQKSGTLTIMDASSGNIITNVLVGSSPYAFGNFATPIAGCSGAPTTFTITVNPSKANLLSSSGDLQALTTSYGSPSAPESFTVSGSGLTGAVTVTAPTGFELSTDGNTFLPAVSIANAGTLTSIPVYLRLTAAAPVGNYSGNVVLSTPGVTDVDVLASASSVTPALLTVIADDKAKTYGEANPELTLSYSGFVNGEGVAQLTTLPVASTDATINSVPGKYLITVAGGSAQNYDFSYIPGILTVSADGRAITPPTAFTPNGDGVNDTWDIKNINFYLNCSINIYNRYGEKVYSSIGYGVPWNGTYRGKYLPAGPYYYVINLNEGNNNIYSGCVTIIR